MRILVFACSLFFMKNISTKAIDCPNLIKTDIEIILENFWDAEKAGKSTRRWKTPLFEGGVINWTINFLANPPRTANPAWKITRHNAEVKEIKGGNHGCVYTLSAPDTEDLGLQLIIKK